MPRNVYQPPQHHENARRDDPIVPSSDVRVRTLLRNINSSAWHNSALSSRTNNYPPVHRNNITDRQINIRETAPPPPKRKRNRVRRGERRAIESVANFRHKHIHLRFPLFKKNLQHPVSSYKSRAALLPRLMQSHLEFASAASY